MHDFFSVHVDETTESYIYAALLIVTVILGSRVSHWCRQNDMHFAMKARVAMSSLIYRKSLRLSRNALAETTVGQVVNLLSNDVGRFDTAMIYIHYISIGVIETVIVVILMYFEIGISAVFGIIVLVVFVPLQVMMAKKTSTLRLKTALLTDSRIRLMNEILQGIQVIKMYAWEKPFGKMIELARRKEIRVIKHVSYIRGVLLSFNIFATRLSIFVSLICYALLGNYLTAEKAFAITGFINTLRIPIATFFPQGNFT